MTSPRERDVWGWVLAWLRAQVQTTWRDQRPWMPNVGPDFVPVPARFDATTPARISVMATAELYKAADHYRAGMQGWWISAKLRGLILDVWAVDPLGAAHSIPDLATRV